MRYCSKACQKSSWYHIHRYICKGSQFKNGVGDKIAVKGLQISSQINGMAGRVVEYSKKKRDSLSLSLNLVSAFLAKPQNMEIVTGVEP